MTIHYPGAIHPQAFIEEIQSLAHDLVRTATDGVSPDDLADAPLLQNFAFVDRPAPVFVGWVTGHPVLDARRIRTSEIYAMDRHAGWARTWSRFYRLAPHADGRRR